MVIKILLTLTILVSGAIIFLSESMIKTKILALNEDKTKLNQDLSKERSELADTKTKLDTTTRERDVLTADLDATKRQLDAEAKAKQVAMQETAAAKQAKAAAEKARDDTIKSNEEWFKVQSELKLTPKKVRDISKELPFAKEQLATVEAEQRILAVRFQQLEGEYISLKNPNKKVMQPDGLRGAVVAVDPKWKFVILNIGGNHGVRKNGELAVSRQGKFIARLKVTSVDPGHSIANVIDGRQADELQEGDEVLAPQDP